MLRVVDCVKDLPDLDLEDFEQSRYLSREFFRVPGALCFLWMVEGRCVSMLRLEPWRDGFLLTGLETLPGERRRGYAAALLTAVQAHLMDMNIQRLYSHIDYRNVRSIRVHEMSGFRRISDTAHLLDGTITARMGTYMLAIG